MPLYSENNSFSTFGIGLAGPPAPPPGSNELTDTDANFLTDTDGNDLTDTE